jgi:hypothetical protein
MMRMDSWKATTAFSILDMLVPQRGMSRAILLKAVPITVGMPVAPRDEEAFWRLLSQAVENAHTVLETVVLPEEEKGLDVGSERDDLPTVSAAVASTGYHAAWFWLMTVRFAGSLASDHTERERCEEAFIELMEWKRGRATLSGEVRLDVLSIIARNIRVNPIRTQSFMVEAVAV